jgi:hypothetical protein
VSQQGRSQRVGAAEFSVSTLVLPSDFDIRISDLFWSIDGNRKR